jgi:hypothetical protein
MEDINTNQISLDTSPPPPEPISIDVGTPRIALDPEDAQKRAFKASFALNGVLDPEEVTKGVESGEEEKIRTQAADKINTQNVMDRVQAVKQKLAESDKPLTDEDLKWVQGTKEIPYLPKDVFERKYAEQYISAMDEYTMSLGDEHFWNAFKASVDPETIALRDANGSITMATHQYIQNKIVNLMAQAKNQSTFGFVVDQAKQFFPAYNETMLRGNVPGVGAFDGGLRGPNLDLQREKIWSLPWNERTKLIDDITDHLSKGTFTNNPSIAITYLSAMLGQTNMEKALHSIDTLALIPDVYSVFKAGSSAINMFRFSQLSKEAMKDLAIASTRYNQTRADVMGAIGNAGGAAAESVATRIERQLIGKDLGTVEQGSRRSSSLATS